jgi:hypothetical protein
MMLVMTIDGIFGVISVILWQVRNMFYMKSVMNQMVLIGHKLKVTLKE